MSTTDVKLTIKRVKAAKEAYFATGVPIMPDDEYDTLEAIVRREGGAEGEAVVAAVGFQKKETGVRLPHVLPSLSKIKPGEKSLARFLSRGGPFVVSEKLDGVSALWVSGSKTLYNRGNGVLGTSISEYAGDIQGLCMAPDVVVRGEICLRRADAVPGSPARSQVNGWLHRISEEQTGPALQLRFIAYQVIEPAGIPRAEQFAWLTAAGFEVPWNKTVRVADEEKLAGWLQARRTDSPYDTDGIVIGTAGVPEPAAIDGANEAKDPSDAVAFKMPLAEQCAETVVRHVEWNAGKTGMLIPRISIEPVVIGSAQIAWVTGHNAKFIADGGIGPGARVIIRRSGDVIPIVDSVICAATDAAAGLPPIGTWKWNSVHAEPLKVQDGQLIAQLLHSLKVLEVEGGGPAAAKAAFDCGLETIRDIIEWSEADAVKALGKTKGPQLIERTRAALAGADTFRRICACPCLGNGIGTRRIKAVVDHYGGVINAVCKEDRPPGWGEDIWEEFVALTWPAVLEQLDDWEDLVGLAAGGLALVAAVAAAPVLGEIVFTGVRDKVLEAASVAAGWTLADTVRKGAKALIIPDSEDPATYSTVKAVKARAGGVEIVRIGDWATRLRIDETRVRNL